jgi:translation initiation factor 2 beta subunit (eIF-2beta)/eIF-5
MKKVKRTSDYAGIKTLVFDAGPIISLASNNLLSTLERLSEHFKGQFVMPESVRHELVDEPLRTKKFMFEALQVQRLISNGVFEVIEDDDTKKLTLDLLAIANNCFTGKGKRLQIIHYAEMAAIATGKMLGSEAVVIDERITRELIEHPKHLEDLMKRRLHTSIQVDNSRIYLLKQRCENQKIIRSTELMTVAFEIGLLDRYIEEGEEEVIPDTKHKLIEGVLWGLKLNGCAISRTEIDKIIKLEETKTSS